MTKPNPENCKNCSSKCAYDPAIVGLETSEEVGEEHDAVVGERRPRLTATRWLALDAAALDRAGSDRITLRHRAQRLAWNDVED